MADAIKEIAGKNGLTFTAVLVELLRQKLAVMGYTIGIGREAMGGGSVRAPDGKPDAG
jgi:hypothetical protein